MTNITPQQILQIRLQDACRYARLLRQNRGHPEAVIYVIRGIWGDEVANIVESVQDTGYELPKQILERKPNNMSNPQTQSPGTHSNDAAHIGENPAIETPETLTQKVERLERRISTLERLLSDVMIQIDKPSKSDNQFASKQKPKGKHPSKGNASESKSKPKKKVESPQIQERILAYLSTETTPRGTRVISQAIQAKYRETKIALKQLLDSQEIIYIQNEGYQRKNPHGEKNAESL